MSEWVVLDISAITKTTKSERVIKILKEVSNSFKFLVAINSDLNNYCGKLPKPMNNIDND